MQRETHDEENVPPPADARLVVERHGRRLPNHGVEREARHGGDRHALGPRLEIKDLGGNDPREGTAGGAEADVVQPRHDDEAPRRAAVAVVGSGGELCEEDGGDDEAEAVGQVTTDEGPPAARLVDEEDTHELRHEGEHRRDGLVAERLVARDADLLVDGDGVVLDRRHARHLHRGLEAARQEQAAEGRAVLEQIQVRLCGALALDGDGLLNLVELGADPRVRGVAVGVQLREGLEALLDAALVDEPAGRLGEEEDEGCEEAGGRDLDSQADAPLLVVRGGEADVGAVRDPGGHQRADSQHELLERGDAATDAGVAELGLVQGDDHGEEADTKGTES